MKEEYFSYFDNDENLDITIEKLGKMREHEHYYEFALILANHILEKLNEIIEFAGIEK